MASATNSRRMSVALLAAATTAVLVWFGSGLFPIWLLLWLAPLPVLLGNLPRRQSNVMGGNGNIVSQYGG